jgi:hypothetical protein
VLNAEGPFSLGGFQGSSQHRWSVRRLE